MLLKLSSYFRFYCFSAKIYYMYNYLFSNAMSLQLKCPQGMFSLFSNEESELEDLAQAKAGE